MAAACVRMCACVYADIHIIAVVVGVLGIGEEWGVGGRSEGWVGHGDRSRDPRRGFRGY